MHGDELAHVTQCRRAQRRLDRVELCPVDTAARHDGPRKRTDGVDDHQGCLAEKADAKRARDVGARLFREVLLEQERRTAVPWIPIVVARKRGEAGCLVRERIERLARGGELFGVSELGQVSRADCVIGVRCDAG